MYMPKKKYPVCISFCMCYHENYSSLTNQTCRTLLEKQRQTHKRCTLLDPHTWPCKSRTTSTNILSAAM